MKKCLSMIALLLAVVMIAMCCAACGDDKKTDDASGGSNNASIIGKWATTIDFDKLPSSALGQDGETVMTEEMLKSFEGVKVNMTISFNEDGTTLVSMAEESAKTVLEIVKKLMVEAMTPALIAQGVAEDQVEAYVQNAMSDINVNTLTGGQSGKYELDGSKLYIFDDKKDQNEYMEIEVSSSEIKVTNVVGDGKYVNSAMLPLTLTKVG